MTDRKIVELKMKFYEDELDDFLALTYLMKAKLHEEGTELPMYNTDVYREGVRPFLDYLKWITGVIHIPSLDKVKPQNVAVEALNEEVILNSKAYQSTLKFINGSSKLKKQLSEDRRSINS